MFRTLVRPIVTHGRAFSVDAKALFEKSCYSKIDYRINQDASVQEAVVRFSAPLRVVIDLVL